MQSKTPTAKVLRVFSRARNMPGLRPVNRDIANPRQRERHQPGHAVLALINAMSVTLEHDN
jgi:hypothetical protein